MMYKQLNEMTKAVGGMELQLWEQANKQIDYPNVLAPIGEEILDPIYDITNTINNTLREEFTQWQR
jgi:hypothetical protein